MRLVAVRWYGVIVTARAARSRDLSLEGHEYAFDPPGSDPALHLDGRDRLELPALFRVLIENPLQ
jgi:hypothetical protein